MRLAPLLALTACYTNAPANRDVQAAWRGRTQAELVDRWGDPASANAEVSVWSFTRRHFELPSAETVRHPVLVTDGMVAMRATAVTTVVHPGAIWEVTTEAAALTDPAGRVAEVQGAALHWGPPNDANLHWGTIFGMHVGMGRLDTTATPLPSGGAYVGGMLSPTLGLVGTFAMAAGTSDTGSAMAFAWGIAPQWWPINRLWLRAGPALLLAMDPGFENARLRPGVTAGASYALLKVGVFALDARLDLAAGTSTAFGTVGIGVNVN